MKRRSFYFMLLILPVLATPAQAGVLRALFGGHSNNSGGALDDGSSESSSKLGIPGVALKKDVAYGSDARQKIDVYIPPQPHNAPIIVMVHGGGWRRGDKASSGVVENKAKHWLPQGFIFISVNNRLLPDADPLAQAADVASALAFVQTHAAGWGGNPSRIILMGHSAGAHLVALLSANPQAYHLKPWMGTVELDSAGMDISKLMEVRHYHFYDAAFGKDPAYWAKASPIDRLKSGAVPMLLVCSTRHENSCDQARAFVEKAHSLGVAAQMQQEDLTHMQINKELGEKSDYTGVVDDFIKARYDGKSDRY